MSRFSALKSKIDNEVEAAIVEPIVDTLPMEPIMDLIPETPTLVENPSTDTTKKTSKKKSKKALKKNAKALKNKTQQNEWVPRKYVVENVLSGEEVPITIPPSLYFNPDLANNVNSYSIFPPLGR